MHKYGFYMFIRGLSKICVVESRALSGHTFDVACGHRVNDLGKLHAVSTK